jgi:proteasome lid subunit RPN8/RPN11
VGDRLLAFAPGLWVGLIEELCSRSDHRRESGAFLLSPIGGDGRSVSGVIYYDDLDATALRGGLRLGSDAYTLLWDRCERQRLRAIGDIHTHPRSIVRQSGIDQANPMIARVGHVALIVPDFAQARISARDVGLHQYLGNKTWRSWFGPEAAQLLDTDGVR